MLSRPPFTPLDSFQSILRHVISATPAQSLAQPLEDLRSKLSRLPTLSQEWAAAAPTLEPLIHRLAHLLPDLFNLRNSTRATHARWSVLAATECGRSAGRKSVEQELRHLSEWSGGCTRPPPAWWKQRLEKEPRASNDASRAYWKRQLAPWLKALGSPVTLAHSK